MQDSSRQISETKHITKKGKKPERKHTDKSDRKENLKRHAFCRGAMDRKQSARIFEGSFLPPMKPSRFESQNLRHRIRFETQIS